MKKIYDNPHAEFFSCLYADIITLSAIESGEGDLDYIDFENLK